MKCLIDLVGVNKIAYPLADREFIGEDWFASLCQQDVKGVIRIRGNMLINSAWNSLSGKKLSAKASKINTILFNGTIDNNSLKFQAKISCISLSCFKRLE